MSHTKYLPRLGTSINRLIKIFAASPLSTLVCMYRQYFYFLQLEFLLFRLLFLVCLRIIDYNHLINLINF